MNLSVTADMWFKLIAYLQFIRTPLDGMDWILHRDFNVIIYINNNLMNFCTTCFLTILQSSCHLAPAVYIVLATFVGQCYKLRYLHNVVHESVTEFLGFLSGQQLADSVVTLLQQTQRLLGDGQLLVLRTEYMLLSIYSSLFISF